VDEVSLKAWREGQFLTAGAGVPRPNSVWLTGSRDQKPSKQLARLIRIEESCVDSRPKDYLKMLIGFSLSEYLPFGIKLDEHHLRYIYPNEFSKYIRLSSILRFSHVLAEAPDMDVKLKMILGGQILIPGMSVDQHDWQGLQGLIQKNPSSRYLMRLFCGMPADKIEKCLEVAGGFAISQPLSLEEADHAIYSLTVRLLRGEAVDERLAARILGMAKSASAVKIILKFCQSRYAGEAVKNIVEAAMCYGFDKDYDTIQLVYKTLSGIRAKNLSSLASRKVWTDLNLPDYAFSVTLQ
jgi:hypothetical protein